MKFVRFGLALALVAVFASPLFAQAPPAGDAAKTAAAKPAATMKSPEDMAKAAVAKWKETLKLTDDQTPKFESAMTDSYKKMAEAKTAAAGDKAKMKASMKDIMKDRREALAAFLTPEQMKTYDSKMTAMAGKAKEHMKTAENEGEKK